jgi:hypothetical protein
MSVGVVSLVATIAVFTSHPAGHRGRAGGSGSSGPAGTDLLGSDNATPSGSASPSAGPSLTPIRGAAAPAVFVHPGVMVSRAELDFMRGKVTSGVFPIL